MKPQVFQLKKFIVATLITSIWINASEVFRYFVFIRPRVRDFFDYKNGIAEIDVSIFTIWGLWDTLLTAVLVFAVWLCTQVYMQAKKVILISGTFIWASVFIIFWVATANMGLSEWSILFIALPLSLFEMLIGAWIAHTLLSKQKAEVSNFA